MMFANGLTECNVSTFGTDGGALGTNKTLILIRLQADLTPSTSLNLIAGVPYRGFLQLTLIVLIIYGDISLILMHTIEWNRLLHFYHD